MGWDKEHKHDTMSDMGGNWPATVALLACGATYHEGVYRGSGTQVQDYSCCRSKHWYTQDTFNSKVNLNTMLIFCNGFKKT